MHLRTRSTAWRRWIRIALTPLAGVLLGMVVLGQRPALGATPLAISVQGDHFVNASGQTIRLLGVNREGTEYACVDGTGYAVGPEDASDAAAIASWHANAVRIPLNEDCWLGINGLPSYGTAAGYRQMIESYVSALNADGVYAILDLQWTAPGSLPSEALRSMPDDNSTAFWTSVASTFAANPAVVFDAFNEPHSVSWTCWRDGGCSVPSGPDGVPPDPTQTFTAVGMQTIVDVIRATGAHQPILLAGLAHGNDLSGWLTYMPSDPDQQLAASFHAYQPNSCNTTTCWDSSVAPVAAVVPTTTIEFSESDCKQTFDNSLMDWDDAHGVGFLGWGWFILTPHCQSLYLITAWDGTPAAPNGTALHDHLAALAAAGAGTGSGDGGPTSGGSGGAPGAGGSSGGTGSGAGPAPASSGGATPAPASRSPRTAPRLTLGWVRRSEGALSIRLRSSQAVSGRLAASTVRSLLVRFGALLRRQQVSLGAKRFSLRGQRWETIRMPLSARARPLPPGWGAVRIRVTVAAADGRTASLNRVLAAIPGSPR